MTTGQLWLDLTGVAPGSDAAILAQRLAPALRARLGAALHLCRRDPGMSEVAWATLDTLAAPPTNRTPARPGPKSRLIDMLARLPPRTRMAIRTTAQLQMDVWRRLRPPPPAPLAIATSVDTAAPAPAPAPGDTLLMLLPRGDASGLVARGVRLVALYAQAGGIARPDWLDDHAAAQCEIWIATTQKLLAHNLTADDLPAAGTLTPRSASPALTPGFVLADGEIGLAGQTPMLLLAWRRLLDDWTTGARPRLVLAGPIGARSQDVLAQLHNSDGFEDTVTLFGHPTEAERAGLRAQCRFALALEPHPGWSRARHDNAQAGVPCLSVPTATGALTGLLRSWLETPPQPEPPFQRGWDDVAADLLVRLRP